MRPTVRGARRRGGGGGGYVTPEWEVLRDFNAGPNNGSANGTSDGFSGNAGSSVYTTEQVYAGSYSGKLTITSGTDGFGQWGGTVSLPTSLTKGDTLWFQLHYFMPETYTINTTPEHLKYLRFRTRQSGGTHRGYLDVYLPDDDVVTPSTTYKAILEGQDLWAYFGPNRRFLRDQWVRQTMQVVCDDVTAGSGGSGRVRFWENGSLILNSTTLKTLIAATDVMHEFYLHTYWNNGNAPVTQSSYVDDIRIAKNGRPSWTLDLLGV